MYDKAKFYSRKFIRNGVAGVLISAYLIYGLISKREAITPILFILPIAALGWLYFGLRISKRLKLKDSKRK